MTVTVLQAVYKKDSPQFLAECFASLAEQNHPVDSILLVKDGCIPTELEAVIAEWQTRLPLMVVGYDENRGLAHALNFGLQYVTTDLVARMDSDDIALSDRFEKQLTFFETHPETQILGGAIKEFYTGTDGKRIERLRRYPMITDKHSRNLCKGTPLAHPTVMARTELLKRYGYNNNTHMNEDIDLWFRLIQDGIVLNSIQEPVINFRITDGTFRRRSFAKARSECCIYFTNCWKLFGVTPLLVYPIARFITRLLPYRLNKKLYFSKSRQKMFDD